MQGIKMWIHVNSNKLISKNLEYIEVAKQVSGAAVPQSKMDATTHINVFKHHLPHLRTSAVFETGSKSLSRTTTKKINPLCLDVFDTDAAVFQIQIRYGSIDLQHLRQFLAECNCARQLFDFTDDSHHNIYTPWTQVHHTSAPSLLQCRLPAKLMSTTVLLHFKAAAKAWRRKIFRAIQFWCLLKKREFRCPKKRLFPCNLSVGAPRQFKTSENKCKFIKDHILPNINWILSAQAEWNAITTRPQIRSIHG